MVRARVDGRMHIIKNSFAERDFNRKITKNYRQGNNTWPHNEFKVIRNAMLRPRRTTCSTLRVTYIIGSGLRCPMKKQLTLQNRTRVVATLNVTIFNFSKIDAILQLLNRVWMMRWLEYLSCTKEIEKDGPN